MEDYTKPGGTAGVDLITLVPAMNVVWDRSFFVLQEMFLSQDV